MPIPLIMVSGKAGVGKDTAAGILGKKYGAVLIAQADPLKRLGRLMGFSDEQLWGPSEMRNAPDSDKEKITNSWNEHYEERLNWLQDIGLPLGAEDSLNDWYRTYVLGPLFKQGCITPRHVLQTLGTEFGRALKPSIWVDYAQERAIVALSGNLKYDRTKVGLVDSQPGDPVTTMAVITDGRFPNEIIATKKNGGFAIKITGPGEQSLGGVAAQHASETEMDKIPGFWYDEIVYNDKVSLLALEGKLDAALYSLKILRDR